MIYYVMEQNFEYKTATLAENYQVGVKPLVFPRQVIQ